MGQKKESKHRIGEKKDIIVQKKYRMGQKKDRIRLKKDRKDSLGKPKIM